MKKKRVTIGKACKARDVWERKPQTQIMPNKKAYTRKSKYKEAVDN